MRVTTLLVLATVLGCTFPEATPAREDSPAARGSWSFELIDDSGQALPTFFHRDRSYVLGTAGKRYRVRVRNQSGRRAEVVVSVDGRDVIDGGPSALEKRGYLVEPYGQVVIDGYRLSEDAVAAFRFGTVSRSYAALEGDARDVGVIGVAVFPERRVRAVPLREAAPAERSAKAESMQDSARPASCSPISLRGRRHRRGEASRSGDELRRGARLARAARRLPAGELAPGGDALACATTIGPGCSPPA